MNNGSIVKNVTFPLSLRKEKRDNEDSIIADEI
jgi:hypothetical protein